MAADIAIEMHRWEWQQLSLDGSVRVQQIIMRTLCELEQLMF